MSEKVDPELEKWRPKVDPLSISTSVLRAWFEWFFCTKCGGNQQHTNKVTDAEGKTTCGDFWGYRMEAEGQYYFCKACGWVLLELGNWKDPTGCRKTLVNGGRDIGG